MNLSVCLSVCLPPTRHYESVLCEEPGSMLCSNTGTDIADWLFCGFVQYDYFHDLIIRTITTCVQKFGTVGMAMVELLITVY